ncbi:hypothetical protein [Roseicyclus mahoneyensis]|uniref:Uncharacterized protein n=1 Tax=Roseicyclus mahoneyensis TaxID=164332 RepID=A0A316GJJ6_9RHOB|nr:hypothetical protein [Roseicyclus mahoneyensis]PWK61184.1 hypothetical protein C7455_103386 [Roseicyclus mahoneyensis]
MTTPNRPFRALSIAAPAFATLALVAFLALPATAQQNLHQDDWTFNLFNDSSIALQAFQIQEMSGAFSHNWLARGMAPGEGLTLEFSDPLDTRCEILTRVVFRNGAVLDGYIDYCGTAIVQVTNEGLFFE